MAYLKGGSYVDGDFYVEGALKVNKIVNAVNEYFPYLSIQGGSKQDYLVIFGSNDGGIRYSPIKVVRNNSTVTFSLSTDDGVSATDQVLATTSSWLIKNINARDIEIDTKGTVVLDYSTEVPRWVYQNG